MGTGTTTLLLYAACCGGVAFVGVTMAVLFAWGRGSEHFKRRRSKGKAAQGADEDEPRTPPDPGA